MEANIIKVGNSKGIILPAQFLKLIGLKNKVSIDIENNKIVITPAEKSVREGWEEMIIKEIKQHGQGNRLMPDYFEDEKQEDWTW